MDKTALVVQHVAFEDLGIIEPVLLGRGFTIQTVQAGVDPLPDDVTASLAIVLGGPIGIADADRYPVVVQEIAWLKRRLDLNLPTLGVCLGGQLIAAALGAEVSSSGRTEIGFAPLTFSDVSGNVLSTLGETPVLHWHGDEFAIPEGCELLASTPLFHNQAFRRGENVLALQFHLEVSPLTLERWFIGNAFELAAHGIDPRDLRRDTAAFGAALEELGGQVYDTWLTGAGL